MNWNEIADGYDAWFETPIGRKAGSLEAKTILRIAEPHEGETIVDVGIGTGYFARHFARYARPLIGIDSSMAMLRRAAAKLDGYEFVAIQGDAVNLPLKAGLADLTVSITVLEFVPNWRKAIAEMVRVTKPQGRIVIAVLNRNSGWAEVRIRSGKRIWMDAHFFTPNELVSELEKYGSVTWTSSVFFGHDGRFLWMADLLETFGRLFWRHRGALLVARCQIGDKNDTDDRDGQDLGR